MFDASTHEGGCEERLPVRGHGVEEEVHSQLVELVVKLLPIPIVQVRLLSLKIISVVASSIARLAGGARVSVGA